MASGKWFSGGLVVVSKWVFVRLDLGGFKYGFVGCCGGRFFLQDFDF